jgi:hypothetical protein
MAEQMTAAEFVAQVRELRKLLQNSQEQRRLTGQCFSFPCGNCFLEVCGGSNQPLCKYAADAADAAEVPL